MPHLTINGQSVAVEKGATVLEAARRLGVRIPTLCHLDGHDPFTSCMVCVVKERNSGRMIPSCSAPAEEGMVVETDTEEIRSRRKDILDLLLSEHVGDCEAPCRTTCPAHMNIPLMIRQIGAGQLKEAYGTVTDMIAMPAVLGYICPAPCEKGCRRGRQDSPLAICLLKRYSAEVELMLTPGEPFSGGRLGGTPRPTEMQEIPQGRAKPPAEPGFSRKAASGKNIAIIGAGPAGLAAAFYLARAGHACTIIDDHAEPGGQLRYGVSREVLPLSVLEAEIEVIRRLGVTFRMNTRIEPGAGLQQLKADHDAVVLAPGSLPVDSLRAWGLTATDRGLTVEVATFRTTDPAIFAGGDVVHPGRMAVRAMGHGKTMACAIDQYLKGASVTGLARRFDSRLGRVLELEMAEFMKEANPRARVEPAAGLAGGFSHEEAVRECERCLHCDCRKSEGCRLRELADDYAGSQKHYAVGGRTPFVKNMMHPRIVFESGKCIKCGICVRITAKAQDNPGLTFIGRGFETVVGVPFSDSLDTALQKTAAECVEKCPTGALAWK